MLLFELYAKAAEAAAGKLAATLAHDSRKISDQQEATRDLKKLQTAIHGMSICVFLGQKSDQKSRDTLEFYKRRSDQLTRAKLQYEEVNSLVRPPTPLISPNSNRIVSDVRRLESLIRAGSAARDAGLETISALRTQHETLQHAQATASSLHASVDESNTVLNRVSSWWNQFRA